MTESEFIERLERSGKSGETLALIESLGFRREFVLEQILNQSGALTVAHIAMLWQGMPNKHDRKRTRALLDALTEAGLLSHDEQAETWTPLP